MDNKIVAAIIPARNNGAARSTKPTGIAVSRSRTEHAVNLAEVITKGARVLDEPGVDRTIL